MLKEKEKWTGFAEGVRARTGAAAEESTLVLCVNVHVHPDASEREVIEVTKRAWTSLEKNAGTGEVCVRVQRGWDGEE
jgi:hypothetical protein